MIALTGATGFVGSHIAKSFDSADLCILGRKKPAGFFGVFHRVEINSSEDYSTLLINVTVIIHAAARAHHMNDSAEDPLTAYREVNTAGTLNLANQAASAGVKRFIFISSIKVNGEGTSLNSPFKYDDISIPEDPYGISKLEAENGLHQISKSTGMEVVIIRPPLVYGAGVKANFSTMMSLAAKNLPLPLGSIKNKRSLVAIDNLVDLIVTCIDHTNAANEIFLVSDDHDVSTTELLVELTRAAGYKPRLINFPMVFIQVVAALLGKKAIADRLCGTLQVDISHTKDTLDWTPPISFEQGIARCFRAVK